MTFRRAVLSLMCFFLVVPMGVALLPERANAAAFGLVPCALKNDDQSTTGWDERAPCTLCHFMIGFQRIISLLRNIMTAIAIAVIVAMAIVYITSAGDEGRMSFAKEGIKWSLIGFAVILLAWVIVNFLFTLPIFANNGLVRTGWDTLSCNTTSQVGWTAAKSSSSISNASGSAASGPQRYGLPGATPGTGGSGGTGGTGGTGGGTTPPGSGGGTGTPTPKCGGVHYACDKGTPVDTKELSDRWTWGCQIDWASVYCIERFEGCGDGQVGGLNQYGAPEQCDEGARNGCGSEGSLGGGSGICSADYCTLCDGSYVPPAAFGCGPSNGTNSAPVEPLCTGAGAIASSVTTSAVGSNNRYDWTCGLEGSSGVINCASGYLTSSGGGQTATCGRAAGVPSATPPQNVDLCATGSLTIHGVTQLTHAQTGEPLWYWSCSFGAGVDGFAATSCYAPRTTGGSGS